MIIINTYHSKGHLKQLNRNNFMANSQEIFEQISELYSQFETEHNSTY